MSNLSNIKQQLDSSQIQKRWDKYMQDPHWYRVLYRYADQSIEEKADILQNVGTIKRGRAAHRLHIRRLIEPLIQG